MAPRHPKIGSIVLVDPPTAHKPTPAEIAAAAGLAKAIEVNGLPSERGSDANVSLRELGVVLGHTLPHSLTAARAAAKAIRTGGR